VLSVQDDALGCSSSLSWRELWSWNESQVNYEGKHMRSLRDIAREGREGGERRRKLENAEKGRECLRKFEKVGEGIET
jgi:hypothetical protein